MSQAPENTGTELDTAALADWMRQLGLINRATLTARALTGGQSNPTFLLTSDAGRYAGSVQARLVEQVGGR